MLCSVNSASPDEMRQFLNRLRYPLVYAYPEFHSFLQQAVGGKSHVICCYSGSTLTGIMPFLRKESDSGVIINSLPWFSSHGGCFITPETAEQSRAAILLFWESLLKAETRLLSAVISLSALEAPHVDAYLAPSLSGEIEDRRTQILNFPPATNDTHENSASLLALLAATARNRVRKSLKQEFAFAFEDTNESWAFLYQTHLDNMKAIGGIAKTEKHFTAFREHIPPNMRKLAIARLDGKAVAGLLLTWALPCVEYMVPAITHDYRSLQPLSFLIYLSMLEAMRDGFTHWNFGGTGFEQHSLFHFKAGWGAIEYPYKLAIYANKELLASHTVESLLKEFPYYYIYPIQKLL